MSTDKPEKPPLKGFPALIESLFNSIKDTPECKEMIKGKKTRVLLNNKEDKWAALITVINDQITVEGVENEPKENISRDKLKWWGYWEFPNLQTIMTARDWKAYKWIRKTAGGKVKGASQIATVGQILALGIANRGST
ncbi:MAG: hypothetical protein ACXAC5_14950 [Promethearchaeota archaeon]|jgi:hypothetical protein